MNKINGAEIKIKVHVVWWWLRPVFGRKVREAFSKAVNIQVGTESEEQVKEWTKKSL